MEDINLSFGMFEAIELKNVNTTEGLKDMEKISRKVK